MYSIRVTEVGEYIRYHSCDRRFKLNTNNSRIIPPQHPAQGMIRETLLDPVLQAAGKQREEECEQYLRQLGFISIFPSEPEAEVLSWQDLMASIPGFKPGKSAYAREVAIEAELGNFKVYGQIDFVLLQWRNKVPYLRLVECKASRKDQSYQRFQVALYLMMARQWLAQTRNSRTQSLKPEQVEAVVVRIDAETNNVQDLVNIEAFDLSLETSDLDYLLQSDGVLQTILDQSLDKLDYTINHKCADCKFGAYCLPESARQRRLELLGLQPPLIRVLQATGVSTIDALADLDLEGELADCIRQDSRFTDNLERLKTLATVRRTTLPGSKQPINHAVTFLPGKVQSQLPPYEIQGERLIRIYLVVDYDYVENRIGALSAHITNSNGVLETTFIQDNKGWIPDPKIREKRDDQYGNVKGKNIIQIASSPWRGDMAEDTLLEQRLLESFFKKLIEKIQHIAGAETTHAPIHFYVWSHQEMKQLIEACTRTSTQLLGCFKELLGCRAGLEQPIYSCLQQEVDNRFALGWTGRDLTVVSSLRWFGQRYHWHRQLNGKNIALDHAFRQDFFDYRRHLQLTPTGELTIQKTDQRHLFEVRLRMQRAMSAPYWRALWRRLPDPTHMDESMRQAIQRYKVAQNSKKLTAFLQCRIHALRWIEERIEWKNDEIRKDRLDLVGLSDFSLGVNSIAKSALDFLRLDHYIKVSNWLSTNLSSPPLYRVGQGRMIPLKNVRALSSTYQRTFRATIDYDAYEITPEGLENNCTLGEGSFVRIIPAFEDPQRSQTLGQLIKVGVTCEIEKLDFASGQIQLSLRGSFRPSTDFYTLNNYFPGDGLEHAVLEESMTDFVAGKVDQRLSRVSEQHWVCQWFDPIQSSVPPQGPLDANKMAKSAHFLNSLVLRADNTGFAPDQRQAILAGLDARVQLLQGPPGTGKTETTAGAVFLRIATRCQPGQIVLIAANTHAAVDTVLLRLSDRLSQLQAHAQNLRLQYPPLKLLRLNPMPESACVGSSVLCVSDYRDPNFYTIPHEYNRVTVIGGTTSAMIKLCDSFPDLDLPLLVVDEASMMPFAHFLALASLIRPTGQIMLAGDHRQLSPIVAHDWEREDRPPTVKYQPFMSAFEAVQRLVTPNANQICSSALTYTFRLPATIRSLLDLLYQRDHIQLQGRPCQGINKIATADQAWQSVWEHDEGIYLIVHTERQSQSNNPLEVLIIQQLLAAAANLEPDSVAIVTPHRAQRSLLKLQLANYYGKGEPIGVIDTVERLQGGERPNIIVSAAVSDPTAIAQEVSFILNLNRSNVAFSRTQQRLIVVCGESLLNYISPDHEQHKDSILWKTLRDRCSHLVAEVAVSDYQVKILEPQYSY